MRDRLFVDADALPLWMGLWGAVSAAGLGTALSTLPQDLLLFASIGAVSSGFAGVWIRVTNSSATLARHRTLWLVSTAFTGAAIGVFALVLVLYEFLRHLSFD